MLVLTIGGSTGTWITIDFRVLTLCKYHEPFLLSLFYRPFCLEYAFWVYLRNLHDKDSNQFEYNGIISIETANKHCSQGNGSLSC